MTRSWIVVALVLVLGSCTTGADGGTVTTTAAASAPSTTATARDLPSASDVYRAVSPSLGFVETPLASGSGVLVAGGLLVTNAHVVWPYRSVEVSFLEGASGSELEVVAVDWAADLALVDVSPIERLPDPVAIGGGDHASGDTVYLIGFPADDPASPEPAITTGVVSRTRTWHQGSVRFIQTDALISGGQSGGALVDATGSVIGITSLEIGEGFALAVDGAVVSSRVAELVTGADTDSVGDRWLDQLEGDAASIQAAHFLDEAVWVFDGTAGEEVVIEATATAPLSGSVIGPDGFLETTMEAGTMGFEVSVDGPHFASIVPEAGFGTTIEVSATVDLRSLADPDHGRTLTVGTTTFGNMDYPGDLDWYAVELAAGETVTITASSPNADTALYVAPLSDLAGDDARSDSDSGAGVIGADAELRYTAADSGTHIVAVFDETQFGPGTYALELVGS